jgi:hypothetical protein
MDELRELVAKWRAEAREIDCAEYKNERSKALASVAASARIDCAAALQVKLDAQPVPAEGAQDAEGTPLREYFRAIVHNIEHLNTEAALNTARAGVEACKAPPATAAPAERPRVEGAKPLCLDCHSAGIINCSHFDNCDGRWVYVPAPPSTPASREPKFCNGRKDSCGDERCPICNGTFKPAAPTTDAGVWGLVVKWRKAADAIDDGTHVTECSKRACDFRSRADELEATLAQQEAGGARVTAEMVSTALRETRGMSFSTERSFAIRDHLNAALAAAAQPPAKEQK